MTDLGPEAYSEPWNIHNPGIFRSAVIFRTLAYAKSEVYSEHFETFTMKRFVKIVNGYNYFYKL